jgi:hypothetical protein
MWRGKSYFHPTQKYALTRSQIQDLGSATWLPYNKAPFPGDTIIVKFQHIIMMKTIILGISFVRLKKQDRENKNIVKKT